MMMVERFLSAGKGFGLRALRRLRAGEELYNTTPLAHCVTKSALTSTCHNCMKRSEKLLRCSQCKTARYCDAQCQKQAWSEHRIECRCLKRLQPKIPTDSVRLTTRIILKLISSPDADADELYSLAEHQSHVDHLSEEKRDGLSQLCAMLQLYLQGECDMSVLPCELDPFSLLARVTCNCFTISDGELQNVGVGLYPSMSLLNHDCQPNCVMVFRGKTLQLRVVRDIEPYEELTISYTDVLAPRMERQAHLSEQYHFLCQCQRCTTDDTDRAMLAGEESVWVSIRDRLPHLEKLQTERRWAELQTETQTLLARHANAVSDSNVYLLRLLDMAMDACISLQQYHTALEYGTRTLGPYKLYYSEPHPCHAVELLRVGKLQHYLGRVEEAELSFRQAHEVMKVTHGSGHPLLDEVRRKLGECQAELSRI